MRRGKFEQITGALRKILSSRGLESRLKEFRLFTDWREIVGPVIAIHAWPERIRGKKLTVIVDSSAWMQQLTMLKPELVAKVNARLGEGCVAAISLRLGEVSAGGRTQPERTAPAGPLTDEERRKIDDSLTGLVDEDLRRGIRRLMEKDFLRKRAGRGE